MLFNQLVNQMLMLDFGKKLATGNYKKSTVWINYALAGRF